MTHLRLARLLGALFTLALTLPALGPVPASAAGSGKPPHRAPAAGQPITVSLTASPAANSPGASTRLTATASMDVGPTPFFIEIFEVGGPLATVCSGGTTCSASVTQSSSWTSYVAYISGYGLAFPPPNIQAQTNPVVVSWAAISATASSTSPLAGDPVTVTATSTLDVHATPFTIVIDDLTSGVQLAECFSGTVCSAQVAYAVATSHQYVAYVAGFAIGIVPPGDIRAASNTVSVDWISLVAVPNLIGAPDGDAPSILQAAGLVLGGDSSQVECGEEGRIFLQSPDAGTRVAPGSAVSVVHGVAPPPGGECP